MHHQMDFKGGCNYFPFFSLINIYLWQRYFRDQIQGCGFRGAGVTVMDTKGVRISGQVLSGAGPGLHGKGCDGWDEFDWHEPYRILLSQDDLENYIYRIQTRHMKHYVEEYVLNESRNSSWNNLQHTHFGIPHQ